jgi:hypothetical protein
VAGRHRDNDHEAAELTHVGPDGGFAWTTPDEEVFRFATDEVRAVGVHLLGRRLYETMLYWETAEQNPALGFSTLEFAALWKALPKVVFSTTLRRRERRVDLELVETRTFGSRVVFLRYRVARRR